jgi:RNA polymerase sigma-70 factor (ECF subfamily)
MPIADQPPLSDVLSRIAADRSDEQAWSALYHRLRPFVVAVLYRQLFGVRGAVDDATQEVFSRLVHYAPFDRLQDEALFRGYLATVCRNVGNDVLKSVARQSRLGTHAPIEVEPADSQAESADRRAELRESFERVLAVLGPEDRAVVVMRYVLGRSNEEIAQRVGATPNAVAVRLHRALQKIRNLFDSNDINP